jgi:hypothetical protein
MILAIILIIVFPFALYLVFTFLKEMVACYGPLLCGFWEKIWESGNLTKFAKILFITLGFILYSIVMLLSLYWLKPLFFKGNK